MITRLAAIALCAALSMPLLWAQAEQTPEHIPGAEDLNAKDAKDAKDEKNSEGGGGPEAESEEQPLSSEVDFNEENFRRSMELRDAALQRSPDLTTGSYSPRSGVKALDALPEASQKHLREQLREVIVENGPWTPAEAGETYPYVPSAEAMENGTLAKREQAAWTELVSKYHEREAALHANLTQSPAGTGSVAGEGPPAQDGGSESEPGENSDKAQRAAALAELLESGAAAGSESAAGAAPPMDQGVSQNALQLLTERQQLPAATAASEATEGQAESGKNQIELDSEGIIAIEDLENVRLDPEAAEKD